MTQTIHHDERSYDISIGLQSLSIQSFLNDKGQRELALKASVHDLKAYQQKMPNPQISIYTATPVELLINACKESRYIAGSAGLESICNFFQAPALQGLINALADLNHQLNILESNEDTLDKLKILLSNLKREQSNFLDCLNNYEVNPSLIQKLSDKLQESNAMLDDQLNTIKPEQWVYLFSAQDRDPRLETSTYSLGHYLNSQSLAFSDALIDVLASPSLGHSQFIDNFILSDLPQKFAQAALAIKRLGSLSYQKLVDTHYHSPSIDSRLINEDGDQFWFCFSSLVNNLNGLSLNQFLHRLVDAPITFKKSAFNYPEELIEEFITNLNDKIEAFQEIDNQPRKKLTQFLKLIVNGFLIFLTKAIPGLFLSLMKISLVFLILPTLALVIDMFFNLFKILNFLTANHLPFLPKIGEQSLLNRYQNYFNELQIDHLDISDNTRAFLKAETKISDFQISGHLTTFKDYIWQTFQSQDVEFIPFSAAESANVIQSMSDRILQNENQIKSGINLPNKTNQGRTAKIYPLPLKTPVHVAHSPMEAVNEVVLALCDEIIAPMRQNYPLTSSIGFSTAALSLTLNAIIPSAMVTRIGLKQLAALLLRPSSFFGKHFLGQAELSQHPVNLFFSLLLQWKFGNFSAELIKELSEPQKIHLNHTLNHVQFYLPALMVGSATGYLFGLLPTTSSAYGLGYTLLVEEASALKKASFPCNALSYTFAMGKLSYFLGSQILIGSQRSTDDSLEGLEVCLSLINQDGPARRLDFEQLINMMQHPLFNQQMLKIDASGRRQFYSAMHELIIKHQQEGQRLPPDAYANLETAFFNRYLRRDYPALLRLPIGCAYIILHPLRHLIRTGLYVLASAQDKPSVAKSNEIEAAIDRVLFDDWSGLLRRILDNFYLTTLLSLRYSVEISLGVLLVLPINLIWMAACLMGGPESLTKSDPFRLTYQSTLYLFKLISSPIVWAAELFFFLTKTVQRLMGYLLHHLKEMLPLNSSIDLFNPNTQAYPSTAEAVHRAAWNTDLRSAVEQIQRALSAQASPTWPACTR